MLIQLGRKTPRWVKALRWGIVLVILVAIVGTGLYLLKRGSHRTDLYRAAVEAMNRGDRQAAEQYLRTLLETGTQRREVATQLVAILLEDERYDEARDLAERWRDQPNMAVVGWQAAIEIALRQLNLVEAEKLAREQAELDPEFAQYTLLRVRDLMGSFLDRWAAQRAAVAMATITVSPEVRARTLLFAAETLRDLIPQAEEGQKERIRRALRRAVLGASSSLKELRRIGSMEGSSAVQELQARVALLSDDIEEWKAGEATLRSRRAAEPEKHQLRASLAAYAVSRSIWADAVEYTRELAEGPPLLWFRSLQRFVVRGRDADALALIRESPHRTEPLVMLHEAQLLLRGDEGSRSAGIELLGRLVAAQGLHPNVALEAYRSLVGAGQAPKGIELLVTAVAASGDALQQAALVEVLSVGGEKTAARSLVRLIAGNLENLPQGMMVLELLRRGDEALLREYLRTPVEGSDTRAGLRLFVRAAAAAAQAQRGEASPLAVMFRDAAKRDLEALGRATGSKAELAQAWQIALALGEPELVGKLAARAIVQEGPPHDLTFGILAWAARTADAGLRRGVAGGMLMAGAETGHRAFFETLSALVERGGGSPAEVGDAFANLATGGDSVEPALYLQAQVAWLQGKLEEGEAITGRLLELTPESPEARDLRGEFLLARKDWAGVVSLHEARELRSLAAYRQMVIALVRDAEEKSDSDETRGEAGTRRERALALARGAVRAYPMSADAHVLLADLLWQMKEQRKALGVLSVAPPTPAVSVRKAQILAEEGENAIAETVLREAIETNPREVQPWRNLYLLMTKMGERGRFIELATEALEGDVSTGDAALRADILLARGMSHLGRAEEESALGDFEGVITLRPDDAVALNNAAWILAEPHRHRLDEALAYARRAVEASPSNADIHDTIAVIHLHHALAGGAEPGAASKRQEELERALASAHQAVMLAEVDMDTAATTGKTEKEVEMLRLRAAKPSFRIHRALIMDALGRRGQAGRELEDVATKFPDRLEGIRAANILKRWARESE